VVVVVLFMWIVLQLSVLDASSVLVVRRGLHTALARVQTREAAYRWLKH